MKNIIGESDSSFSQNSSTIVDAPQMLLSLDFLTGGGDTDLIVNSLKKDLVILVKNVEPDDADNLMFQISKKFGLSDKLELQAGYASSLGHRHNIGKYFMSVNKRENSQFVCPHSEGNHFSDIQLASFYGYDNTTDGGETILLHVDEHSESWGLLLERAFRGECNRVLTQNEILQARTLFKLNIPEDILSIEDEILKEVKLTPDITLFEVLAKPRKTYSVILKRSLYAFWDSIERVDTGSPIAFMRLLEVLGILKPAQLEKLDDAVNDRVNIIMEE